MTEIKICGIQTPGDISLLQKYQIDYAGFVMFYPGSKRNHNEKSVIPLLRLMDKQIQRVAVAVSPDLETVRRLEQMDFDILQIHGAAEEEILSESRLLVWRAINIEKHAKKEENIMPHEKIKAYVFDGKAPGKGEVFDWNLIRDMDTKGKRLVLAGGLHAGNVQEGIRKVRPDIVDVSSGVENTAAIGKDEERLKAFVKAVREIDR